MLVTARSRSGAAGQRGVVGHARSADLLRRQVQPPLSRPDTGFWHLEVPQVEVVAGRAVLIFCCLPGQLSPERREASGPGAIWCVPADSVLGPFDTGRAVPLTGEDLYSTAGGWSATGPGSGSCSPSVT